MGLSFTRIKNYLHRWAVWWLRTTGIWNYDELLNWFICACWANNAATAVGTELQDEARVKVFLRPFHGSKTEQQALPLFHVSLAAQ